MGLAMATIGEDCHVTIAHAEINGGAPSGFITAREGSIRAGGAQVRREVYSDGTLKLTLYVDILLADSLVNPNGSPRAGSRAADYALLSRYLERRSGLEVGTPVGVFANLGALGHAANELHLPDRSLVRCQFNNAGTYWPPVDPALLTLSTWDGTLSWSTSYWR
jgi:hypothetical protein